MEITAPEAAMGDFTGDPAARRGQVTGKQGGLAGNLVVRARAPMSALAGYQTRLNAMTSGAGHNTLVLSHREPVPPAVQQQLTAGRQAHDSD